MSKDLSADELAEIAHELADRTELWLPHVRHDPSRRIFHKVLQTEDLTAWLICWMPGHDTGFHDHDGSAGAVAVIRGTVREERLRVGAEAATTVAGPGGTLRFGPSDIHRVRHEGTEPAVTMHAYSPILRRMGQYVVDEDGVLTRVALDEDVELTAELV